MNIVAHQHSSGLFAIEAPDDWGVQDHPWGQPEPLMRIVSPEPALGYFPHLDISAYAVGPHGLEAAVRAQMDTFQTTLDSFRLVDFAADAVAGVQAIRVVHMHIGEFNGLAQSMACEQWSLTARGLAWYLAVWVPSLSFPDFFDFFRALVSRFSLRADLGVPQ